jgi:uncharacterized protein (DUF58 family)
VTLPWRQRLMQWQALRSPPAPRVQLDHRRIYILPSPSGWGYLFTLALIFLAAVNYQNSMAYALAFCLGGLFVIAILHTYRNLSGLVVLAELPAPVFAGEHAQVGLSLESNGRPHLALHVGWTAQQLQRVDLEAGAGQRLALLLPAAKRGWLRAPRMRLQTQFPLGLLRAWSWVDLGQRVLVYPKPLAGPLPARSGPAVDPEDHGWHVQAHGVDDFQGLQEYRPGDSWRRLHWKAYSRGQALLVKTFTDVIGQDPALDFDALDGPEEVRLSVLCHWVLELAAQGRPFALRLPGLTLPAAADEPHREASLRALALYGHRS